MSRSVVDMRQGALKRHSEVSLDESLADAYGVLRE